MSEATQEGVSEEALEQQAQPENETTPVNPRDEIMADLYEKADIENMANQPEVEPEPEPESEKLAEEEPAIEEQEPAVEMVTIKVDGEEVEVPMADVIAEGIRAKQKMSAADSRLAEASEILKLAKEKSEQEPEHEPTDEDKEGDEAVGGEYGKKFVKAVYDGEGDEAAAIIDDMARQMNQRGQTTTESELIDQAVFEMERREAMRSFKSDDRYASINNDEELFNRWNRETELLMNEHQGDEAWGLKRISQEAGDRINRMFSADSTPSSLDAKRAAVSKSVSTTSTARSPSEPEYKPKTPAQVVEDIRKSRGQQ